MKMVSFCNSLCRIYLTWKRNINVKKSQKPDTRDKHRFFAFDSLLRYECLERLFRFERELNRFVFFHPC